MAEFLVREKAAAFTIRWKGGGVRQMGARVANSIRTSMRGLGSCERMDVAYTTGYVELAFDAMTTGSFRSGEGYVGVGGR